MLKNDPDHFTVSEYTDSNMLLVVFSTSVVHAQNTRQTYHLDKTK